MPRQKYSFVVFSDDWARHPSSSQHLFREISKKHKVLWVNTIGLRVPQADKFTFIRGMEKIGKWLKPFRKVNENLSVLDLPMLPVMGDSKLARFNARFSAYLIRLALNKLNMHNPIFWTSVPNSADFLGLIGESAVIYYVTDDYSHWPGANADKVKHADKMLSQNADLILACTKQLSENYNNAKLLQHAVDFEHFVSVISNISELEELKNVKHPRVCFFGLIYEKVDIDGLYRLASTLEDVQLVLIGPVKTDISKLACLHNVHVLGAKPYEELPKYLHSMDVLLLPYVNDEQIRQSGPLKIRECLAVAKHIVAVNIPDLKQYSDVIELYDTTEQMISNVQACISDNISEEQMNKMRNKVRADTWQKRADEIIGLIDNLVRVDIETRKPDWQTYINKKNVKSIFYDWRWAELNRRVYHNKSFYLTAYRKNEVVGLCQLTYQKSFIFGRHLTSLPYFDISGILADNIEAQNALIRASNRIRRHTRSQWVELRQTGILPAELPGLNIMMRTDKVDLKLKLPESTDILWDRLKPKVRNLIRKARNNNLQAIRGRCELLSQFYNVYLDNMRNLGSPPHSLRFFEEIFEEFAENIEIFVVSYLGNMRGLSQPVAAGFAIANGEYMYIPWAASLWRYKHLSANMLLYWEMLEYAVEQQFEYFDFGRSTIDSGTYKFKKQWGADDFPLYWHYILDANNSEHEFGKDNEKYKLFINVWKRLPICLTRLIGPKLISKLS